MHLTIPPSHSYSQNWTSNIYSPRYEQWYIPLHRKYFVFGPAKTFWRSSLFCWWDNLMEIVSNRTDCKILSDERAEFDCHQVPHICIIASIFCGKTDGIRQQSWNFWKEENQPSQFLFQNPSDFLYCQCDKRAEISLEWLCVGSANYSSCLHLWTLEWVNNWLHYIANFCGQTAELIWKHLLATPNIPGMHKKTMK